MKALRLVRILVVKFPRLLALNAFLLLGSSLLEAAAVVSLAPLVDFLMHADPAAASSLTRRLLEALSWLGVAQTLTSLLVVFVALNFLRSLVLIVAQHVLLRTRYVVLQDLMFGVFDDFLHARWSFFTSTKQGTLLNTFLREIAVVADAFGCMGQILANILQMTLYLAVPLYVSWQLTVLCLAAAVLFAAPFGMAGKLGVRLGQRTTDASNNMGTVINECIGSAKIIIGFGNHRTAQARLHQSLRDFSRAMLKSQTLVYSFPLSYYPFGMSVFALALWGSQHWNVPLSSTAVVLYSLVKIVPAISGLVGQKNMLDTAYPSYEQVVTLGAKARQMRQPSGPLPFDGLQHQVVMKNVGFAYPENDPVLSDVNVRIPRGCMVAFVGTSGAGKSTLIDLIMRFHDPTMGRIEIDGVSLTEFEIDSYRSCIGYVPQDSILFNATVRENLLWAKEGASDEEMRLACREANAEEFIERLPEKYETALGDRGIRLSGGQIQRLALARAILRRPDLLILDEATSSLDTQSERLIQSALEKIAKATTLIVIAHRLSSIVNADYIYVLAHGTIVEEGTYADLIQVDGPFARMTQLQVLEASNAQDAPFL